MNLFDRLVQQAMLSDEALGTVRPAVEKELLHHDILREMSEAGLLKGLTFIGGTCLRACYGSPRLSEDLDFTGGADFDASCLSGLGTTLTSRLMEKYGLPVSVSEPIREEGNVRTWKMRIQTRPENQNMPAQRIHLDICSIPSHDRQPSLLRNSYGINMGTEGLILQAESREEIYADKWIALAFRPNRMQYRDLWDILWLEQHAVELNPTLISQKIKDRKKTPFEFLTLIQARLSELETKAEHEKLFRQEMERFLPATTVRDAVHQPQFWTLLINGLNRHVHLIRNPISV